jgi:hypothetical protein
MRRSRGALVLAAAAVTAAAARRRSRPVPLSQLGGVRGVAVGAGAVWVTTGGQVVRVDPARVPG